MAALREIIELDYTDAEAINDFLKQSGYAGGK